MSDEGDRRGRAERSECARRRPSRRGASDRPDPPQQQRHGHDRRGDADALQRPGRDALSLLRVRALDGGGGAAAAPAPRPPLPLRRRRRRLRFASRQDRAGAARDGADGNGRRRVVAARRPTIGVGRSRRLRVAARPSASSGAPRPTLPRPRAACFAARLGAPALAPLVGVSGRNRRLDDRAPVERDVGILRFERAAHLGVERLRGRP